MRKLFCDSLADTPYSASSTDLIVSHNYLSDLREGVVLAIYDSKYGDISTAKRMKRLEFVRLKSGDSSARTLSVIRAQFGTNGIDFDAETIWNVIYLPNISSNETDVTEYGARAEAGFDSTDAFQRMADEHGIVMIPYSEIPFEIDAIATTRPTVFRAKNGMASLKLREPERRNSPGILLAHDQSGIDRGIHIDGNATARSCVRIPADDCFVYVTCENVTSDSNALVYTSGVEITGDRCRFDVRGYHFKNTGHSNESSPRVVTIQAEADDYDGSIHAENIECVLCLGRDTGQGRLSQLYAKGAEDNGIYQLGGTLTVNEVVYHGNEEGVVVGGRLFINNYQCIGAGSSPVNLAGGEHLEINNLEISMDGEKVLQSSMRIRSGRNFGDVYIKQVKGRMRGNTLIGFPSGTIRSLTIDRFDMEYEYDRSVSGPITQFCNLTAVEQFSLKDFHVRIIDMDDALTSSNFFEVRLPSVSEQSYLINPRFWTLKSNGEGSPAPVRILRFAQRQFEYTGLNIQTNIGPYGREQGYLGESVPGRNVAAAPPQGGDFAIGTVIESSEAVARGVLRDGSGVSDLRRDGGLLDVLRGLFGGRDRSDAEDGGRSGADGSGESTGEVVGWEYTEDGWREIRE